MDCLVPTLGKQYGFNPGGSAAGFLACEVFAHVGLLTRVEIELSWRLGGFADAAPWRLLEVYIALREWD